MAPWYLKIPVKMVLARTPVPRSLPNRLGIFRHGGMRRPDYALEIVQRHTAFAQVDLIRKRVLELGQGGSVGPGLVACTLGSLITRLISVSDWVTRDFDVHLAVIRLLDAVLPTFTRLRRVDTNRGVFSSPAQLLDYTDAVLRTHETIVAFRVP